MNKNPMILQDAHFYSDRNKYEVNQDLAGYMTCRSTLHVEGAADAVICYVCDGVSNARGSVATKLMERALRPRLGAFLGRAYEFLTLDIFTREVEIHESLKDLILDANNEVLSAMESCATTVSIAFALDNMVYTANLGDSPIFLLQIKGTCGVDEIKRLYCCHNEAGVLMEKGSLTHDDLFGHNSSHILSRPVVGNLIHDYHISVFSHPLYHYSLLLMGSDGALSVLPEAKLKQLVDLYGFDLPTLTSEVYREVRCRGGEDNFTLLSHKFFVEDPLIMDSLSEALIYNPSSPYSQP